MWSDNASDNVVVRLPDFHEQIKDLLEAGGIAGVKLEPESSSASCCAFSIPPQYERLAETILHHKGLTLWRRLSRRKSCRTSDGKFCNREACQQCSCQELRLSAQRRN